MKPLSASHRRAADATSVSSTVTRSNVERLITLSTSAGAGCWSRGLLRAAGRWRWPFWHRAIHNCDDGLVCEARHQLDLLISKWPYFPAPDGDNTDQVFLTQ